MAKNGLHIKKKDKKTFFFAQMTFAQIQEKEDNGFLKIMIRFCGTPTDNELHEYLYKVKCIYDRNIPFYILYDACDIGMLSPSQISQQVQFMRNHDIQTKKLIQKCGICVSTTWAQVTLDCIFKIKSPACPLKIFTDLEKAKDYLRQH